MSNSPSDGRPRPLTVCIVDMNHGHANQAMRCLRGIVARFFDSVWARNPNLSCVLTEVSPRDTQAGIPRGCDLYLSSGGPGSPHEGDGSSWATDYARLLDGVVESAARSADQQSLFGVCYSFQRIALHFAVAAVTPRAGRKFGVMPIYTTPEGRQHPLLEAFGDRLFAFEHRHWEAVELDLAKLKCLGGAPLAQESRDGISKGRAVLALDVAPGIEAVQFHPEADRAGIANWVACPEHAAALKAVHGEVAYEAMLRTLDDPRRVARTFALLIPGWMTRRFNLLAQARGYAELSPPPEKAAFAASHPASTAPASTVPESRPSQPGGA